MDELLSLVSNDLFESHGWIDLLGVRSVSQGLLLDLEASVDEGAFDDWGAPQRWCVSCSDVCEVAIRSTGTNMIALEQRHPLTAPYGELTVDLHFHKPPSSIDCFIGELYLEHIETTLGWLSIGRFLRWPRNLRGLLAGKFGLLARGPRSILDRYAVVLDAHDMKPHLTNKCRPTIWKNGAWHEASGETKVVILGDSFVVAEQIIANRRD